MERVPADDGGPEGEAVPLVGPEFPVVLLTKLEGRVVVVLVVCGCVDVMVDVELTKMLVVETVMTGVVGTTGVVTTDVVATGVVAVADDQPVDEPQAPVSEGPHPLVSEGPQPPGPEWPDGPQAPLLDGPQAPLADGPQSDDGPPQPAGAVLDGPHPLFPLLPQAELPGNPPLMPAIVMVG